MSVYKSIYLELYSPSEEELVEFEVKINLYVKEPEPNIGFFNWTVEVDGWELIPFDYNGKIKTEIDGEILKNLNWEGSFTKNIAKIDSAIKSGDIQFLETEFRNMLQSYIDVNDLKFTRTRNRKFILADG